MSNAEGPIAEQVVEILPGGSSGLYGSGYQIGPNLVLTAQHVVADAEELCVRFGTRADGEPLAADVVWNGTDSIDLALVKIRQELSPGMAISRSPEWGFLPSTAEGLADGSVPFSAVGFPRYQGGRRDSGHPFRDTVTVQGQVQLGSYHKTGMLDLTVSSVSGTRQIDWKGLSGAAIFVYGSLVGVVVTARRGRDRLTGVPIAAVLTQRTLRFPEFTASLADRQAVMGVLARSGITTRTVPARRRPYAATIQELAARCPDLLGRDAELGRLGKWLRSATPYALWSAAPWAGKTALAARLAADPPPGVDVVAFFISRARGAQAGKLWAAVADQLAALLYEQVQDGDLEFEQLWRRVCQASRAAGRTLLLLLDGMDEFEERSTASSLLARLPYDPPPHAHVLLLTRPNPDPTRAVPPDHPLLDAARCDQVDLDPSPHALGLRDRARLDLETVLDEGGTPLRALRLIADVGPLGEQETFQVIRGPDSVVDDGAVHRALTSGASGRLLSPGPRARRTRFALAHDTLREELLEHADPEAAETDIARLLVMADQYAAQGWPEDTPDFMLDEYPSLLAHRGDMRRLTATTLSPEWLDLARSRTNTVLSAAAALRRALTAIAGDPAADLATLLLLAGQLDELSPPPSYHTASFVTAWAQAGELEYAEHVALRLIEQAERGRKLIDLAAMAADAGSRDRAVHLLDRAAESAPRAHAGPTGGDGGRRHAPDTSGVHARGPGGSPEPGEPAEPPASDKGPVLDFFLRLQQLAVRLGRVGLAREAGEEIWSLLPLLPPAGHLGRWVFAIECAAAIGDVARVNLGIIRLARIPQPVSLKRRLDEAVGALGSEELASRLQAIPVYAGSSTEPGSSNMAARAREEATPDSPPASQGPASQRPALSAAGAAGTAADPFDAIRAAISAGAYPEAAALIDEYQHPVTHVLDLIEGGEARVVSAAKRAAAAGGRAAVPVIAAAERYVRCRELKAELEWTSSVGGAFPVHGIMDEPGGTFLAEIVEVAARHGQLEEVLRHAPVSSDLATRTQDFGALAVGAARSGLHDVADRLLDGVRDHGPPTGACYEVARCWAQTDRWRDAIDLMSDFSPSPERSHVTATAALTAIASGDLQDGISLVLQCAGVETLAWDADDLISAAATTAAEADHWPTALDLAETLDDGRPRAELWAELSVIAHDAGDHAVADHALERAFRESRELPLPADRARALGGCAAAAFRRGDLAAGGEALGQAAQDVQGLPDEGRTDCLLDLAAVAAQLGDEARVTSLLHQAAAAARLIQAAESGTERLAAVAAAACAAGPPPLAASLLAEVADSPHLSSLTSVGELVTVAAKNHHETEALRLLRRFAAVRAPEHFLPYSPERRRASHVAAIAAGAGLWPVIDEALAVLEPHARKDVLAELAAGVRGEAPKRAHRWICQAFLLGISPRLLAAAAKLDPNLALPAVRIFLARSHASVSPDHA